MIRFVVVVLEVVVLAIMKALLPFSIENDGGLFPNE